MVRTRSPLFEEKRNHIRDACARLFAEKGFPAASIEDISKACGVLKSVLYHYYKSKDAILSAIITDHVEHVHATVAASVDGTASPEEQFERFTTALIATYVRCRPEQTVLNNDRHFLSRLSKRKVHTSEKRLIELTSGIIGQINTGIETDSEAANVLCMLYFGTVNWTYTWYRPGGTVKPDQLAKLVVEIYLNGVRTRSINRLLGDSALMARREQTVATSP